MGTHAAGRERGTSAASPIMLHADFGADVTAWGQPFCKQGQGAYRPLFGAFDGGSEVTRV